MVAYYFVAQEDTNVYNVFCVDEFAEDGYLEGHNGEEGYHIDDFDIIAWFETFTEACEWVDNNIVL